MPVAYPVFPATIIPTYQMSKEVKATGTDKPLGDGYAYRTQFGLHPLEEGWRVSFLVTLADAATARAFLEARATDGVPFQWTPPDAYWDAQPGAVDDLPGVIDGCPLLWSVDEWPISRSFQGRVSIDLLLRRRFDFVMNA